MSITVGFTTTVGELNLTTGDYRVSDTDAYSPAQAQVKTVELARADGNVQLLDRLQGRTINMSGTINTDTSLNLREAMDTLNVFLLESGKLRMTEDGNYREWTAKLANIVIRRGAQELTRATWSAQFISEKPYAESGYTDELINSTGITAASSTLPLTVYGSYPAYADITITINDIDPDTSDVTFYIENQATGQQLAITGTFVAGDTITINTLRRLIFHNSTLVNGEGDYPIWFNGAGNLVLSDSATTRDVDILVENTRRYV
jgi:hypothetical protein